VRSGGHNIPGNTIRQRYERSVRNFWTDYRGLADTWFVYDNSGPDPDLIAAGSGLEAPEIGTSDAWPLFQRLVSNA
jgi:predicted ABC-type ATPase